MIRVPPAGQRSAPKRAPSPSTVDAQEAFDRLVTDAVGKYAASASSTERPKTSDARQLKRFIRPAPLPPARTDPPSEVRQRLIDASARGEGTAFEAGANHARHQPPDLPQGHWATGLWRQIPQGGEKTDLPQHSAHTAVLTRIEGILDLQRRAVANVYGQLNALLGPPRAELEILVHSRLAETFAHHNWSAYRPLCQAFEMSKEWLSWGTAGRMLHLLEDIPTDEPARIVRYLQVSRHIVFTIERGPVCNALFSQLSPTQIFGASLQATREALADLERERFHCAAELFGYCGSSLLVHAPTEILAFNRCLKIPFSKESQALFDRFLAIFLTLSLKKPAVSLQRNSIETSEWIASGLFILSTIDPQTLDTCDKALKKIANGLFGGRIPPGEASLLLSCLLSLTSLNREEFWRSSGFTPSEQQNQSAGPESLPHPSPHQRSIHNQRLSRWVDHMVFLAPRGQKGLFYGHFLRVVARLHEPVYDPRAWETLSSPLLALFDAHRAAFKQLKAREKADRLLEKFELLTRLPVSERPGKAIQWAQEVISG